MVSNQSMSSPPPEAAALSPDQREAALREIVVFIDGQHRDTLTRFEESYMSTKATAARIYEYGEPDVFRFETMDVPDPVVSGRVSELEQKKIFSQCSREKPCWLTEWGIPNGQSCPINDANRANVIEAERDAFKPCRGSWRQSSTTPGAERPRK